LASELPRRGSGFWLPGDVIRGTLWPGNGVCRLVRRVNRLTGFSADNSYQRHMRWRGWTYVESTIDIRGRRAGQPGPMVGFGVRGRRARPDFSVGHSARQCHWLLHDLICIYPTKPCCCGSSSGNQTGGTINRSTNRNCDLIVVGHSDHSELWGRLLGDTADRISDHAHCSVLIVKS
jgi:hypothetical protein